MTAATLPAPAPARPRVRKSDFDIAPALRGLIGAAGLVMTTMCAYAILRWLAGFASDYDTLRNTSVAIHVATVIPAVPLGAYLLLARKGTKLHKQLGKLWVALMVVTAVAITFSRGGTDFSWIHVFVPITLFGSWKTIATARAGNIKEHKSHLIGMYLGALMIPGVFSFLPNRLMGVLLYG